MDVTGVTLIPSSASLLKGDSLFLRAIVLPEDSDNKNVTFSSDSPETVLVNSEGKVTALKEGTSIITVTTEEGGFTDTCVISVSVPVNKLSVVHANPGDSYIDQCSEIAIALIYSLAKQQITQYEKIMRRYCAATLSNISMKCALTKMAMNSMLKIKDEYFNSLRMNFEDITAASNEQFNMVESSKITKIMSAKLEDAKTKIESTYNIPHGSLSIYNKENVEQGINYSAEKENSPSVFSYIVSKKILHKMIDMTNVISDKKNSLEDENESNNITYVKKAFKPVLEDAKSIFQDIKTVESLNVMLDGFFLAGILFKEYIFSTRDQIDLFLGRKYSTIRVDIVAALKKRL